MADEPLPPVEALIPHRGPALMLRHVLELDDDSLECVAAIPAESGFVAGGEAPSLVGIDVLAQAAGVLEAFRGRHDREGGPRVGYLVGVREARFDRAVLPAEKPLLARVRRVSGLGGLVTHEARLSDQNQSLLWAVVTTFVPAAEPGSGAR